MTVRRVHWIAAFAISIAIHLALVIGFEPSNEGMAARPAGAPVSVEGNLAGVLGAATDVPEVIAEKAIEFEIAPPEIQEAASAEVTPVSPVVEQTAVPELRSNAAPELTARLNESAKPIEAIEEAIERSEKKPKEEKALPQEEAEQSKSPKQAEARKPKPKSRRPSSASRAGDSRQGAGGSSRGGRGGSQAASAGAVHSYAARVRARILANRPGSVGHGRVVVSFGLSSSGGLRYASVARSSGSSILDQAALAAVRHSSPFPSPPSGASARQLQFSISFTFQ